MAVVNYLTIDGEIVSEARNGVVSDYIPDPLGNVAKILNTSQQITDSFVYWPYGEVKSHSGSNPTPFQFVGSWGYYMDTGTRTYVRKRTYEPSTATWHQLDLIWPRSQSYGYVQAQPTSAADPTGLSKGSKFWRCMQQEQRRGWSPQDACGICKKWAGSGVICSNFPNTPPSPSACQKCPSIPPICQLVADQWNDRMDSPGHAKWTWASNCVSCCEALHIMDREGECGFDCMEGTFPHLPIDTQQAFEVLLEDLCGG